MKPKIICKDNLEALRELPDKSVKLIYADPQFLTGRDFKEYDDRWDSVEDYKNFIKPRIEEFHRVLKDDGSLFLHSDYHANAHLRIMSDEIFGKDNLLNEIIWNYRKWTGRKNILSRRHDTIFWYTKGKDYTFNTKYEPLSPSTMERWKGKIQTSPKDKDGRRLSASSNKRSKGAYLSDVWSDINLIAPSANERTGYPTQKPEKLLKRIIELSSNKGDLVADFFAGSGTACKVASELGRESICVDINENACKIMEERLS